MQEEGCQPNVVTYNTLIDVYGKMGRWEDAVKVLSDMADQVRPLAPSRPPQLALCTSVGTTAQTTNCTNSTVVSKGESTYNGTHSYEYGQSYDTH